ncbi:MAG: hypothetical protein H7234_05580 [Herminiimonas sp.]|nr:hypothetical protein [Herminiimonas sp.]
MSEQAKALGALLLTITDLCDKAELHGIVENPPPEVLAPLIDDASQLGIAFEATPGLTQLQTAVEAAAQRAAGVPD